MNTSKLSTAVLGKILTSALVLIALGYALTETISLGKQNAVLTESLKNTRDELFAYKDAQNKKDEKVAEDIIDLKVSAATTKELVSLISEKYQIDPRAVEFRVKEQIQNEKDPATTTNATAAAIIQ